jgi:hypothetical protein
MCVPQTLGSTPLPLVCAVAVTKKNASALTVGGIDVNAQVGDWPLAGCVTSSANNIIAVTPHLFFT